jgi:nitroreductase
MLSGVLSALAVVGRTVLALALIALAGCGARRGGGIESWRLDRRYADPRLTLVSRGVLAQSAHNMQPWRVVLDRGDPSVFRLYAEPRRLLPETDPVARQITLSMGTFLAVVEDAAAELDYEIEIELFPEGDYELEDIGNLPVAEISLRGDAPQRSVPHMDALSTATVKSHFEGVILARAERSRILAHSDLPGLRAFFVQDPADMAEISPLFVEAFHREMENEPTLMESYRVTRVNRRQREESSFGLAYTAMFPAWILPFVDLYSTLFPMAPDQYAVAGIESFTKTLQAVRSYLFLVSAGNSRKDQVLTGMALQRMWLESHSMGLAVLPVSQALQEYPAMSDLYGRIHSLYADRGETIQMILALGRPRGRYAFSPRLTVEEVVEER